MTAPRDFDFESPSVSDAYNSVLVPLLFEPWAEHFLEQLPPLPSWAVLDLATGTGIVAQKLAERLGPHGSVVGVDISAEMLSIAGQRCSSFPGIVSFIESPAYPLRLDGESVDAIYCQQGFQFFPDKVAAAREMYRVLSAGGKLAVSTWCPLDECQFFKTICSVLRQCGEDEIARMMSVPFDFMPKDELFACFSDAGFERVVMRRCEMDIVFSGGVQQACASVYATPIGPRLSALSPDKQAHVRDCLLSELAELTSDGVTKGSMASLVMTAERSGS